MPHFSPTELESINYISNNGDDRFFLKYCDKVKAEFVKDLIGVEMGSAYGGNVEAIARLWQGIGDIYGYDTFTGHPKQIANNPEDFEATCMNYWYKEDVCGTANLSLEYQQGVMAKLGIDNAHFVKGLINKDSCRDLPRIHVAFLDLDLVNSMRPAFEAVADKIVLGGYLLMHDVVNQGSSLQELEDWYKNVILKDIRYKFLEQSQHFAVALQRI